MSACALLNLLNKLKKEIKWEACQAFYLFFARSLINSIIPLVPNSVTTIFGFSLIRHEFSLTTVTKLLRQRHGI